MSEKWDDKGAGAVFFLQQEMTDAVTGVLLRRAFFGPSVFAQQYTSDAVTCTQDCFASNAVPAPVGKRAATWCCCTLGVRTAIKVGWLQAGHVWLEEKPH